jgi:prepilin-type N-terminal cleavage/methylation domain-containing protein
MNLLKLPPSESRNPVEHVLASPLSPLATDALRNNKPNGVDVGLLGHSRSQPQYGEIPLGFTLAELLASLAVLLVATSLVVPPVFALARSSAKRCAIGNVLSSIEQTRCLAIANSAPYSWGVAGDDMHWPKTHRCRAYAIFREFQEPSTGQVLRTQESAWSLLPEGLLFDRGARTPFQHPAEPFPCATNGGNGAGHFLSFTALGALASPREPGGTKVGIVEGSITATGVMVSAGSAGYIHRAQIQIVSSTGRARITQLER